MPLPNLFHATDFAASSSATLAIAQAAAQGTASTTGPATTQFHSPATTTTLTDPPRSSYGQVLHKSHSQPPTTVQSLSSISKASSGRSLGSVSTSNPHQNQYHSSQMVHSNRPLLGRPVTYSQNHQQQPSHVSSSPSSSSSLGHQQNAQ